MKRLAQLFSSTYDTFKENDIPVILQGYSFNPSPDYKIPSIEPPKREISLSRSIEKYIITHKHHIQQNRKLYTLISSMPLLSYRKHFVPIPGTRITSDSGWGCCHRCMQMLTSTAIIRHFVISLTRSQLPPYTPNGVSSPTKRTQSPYCIFPLHYSQFPLLYKRSLALFADSMTSPLSIHSISLEAESSCKVPRGSWLKPQQASFVMEKIFNRKGDSSISYHLRSAWFKLQNDIQQVRSLSKSNLSSPQASPRSRSHSFEVKEVTAGERQSSTELAATDGNDPYVLSAMVSRHSEFPEKEVIITSEKSSNPTESMFPTSQLQSVAMCGLFPIPLSLPTPISIQDSIPPAEQLRRKQLQSLRKWIDKFVPPHVCHSIASVESLSHSKTAIETPLDTPKTSSFPMPGYSRLPALSLLVARDAVVCLRDVEVILENSDDVLLLIPLLLGGGNSFDRRYEESLLHIFTLSSFVGVVGGEASRPRALFFPGFTTGKRGTSFITFDPHTTLKSVSEKWYYSSPQQESGSKQIEDNIILSSFFPNLSSSEQHSLNIPLTPISNISSSMVIGLLFHTKRQIDELICMYTDDKCSGAEFHGCFEIHDGTRENWEEVMGIRIHPPSSATPHKMSCPSDVHHGSVSEGWETIEVPRDVSEHQRIHDLSDEWDIVGDL
ncbi:Peptidase C54 like protein [Aduncisulcus paluster]|uniref:Cysteine protease n=1 Tax=Aduncisulcus paluster TaxID=2918883 RepID=A0ABQ5KKT2_9EUKA|nr:Peptidase C54 like protein [Aduncisulcus paluster]